MARLDVVSGAFDNAREPFASLRKANLVNVSPDEVLLARGASVFAVEGTGFVQNARGDFVAGTVTAIAERKRGALLYTLGELEVPAQDFFRFLDRDRRGAFRDTLFGGDDVLNGGSAADRLFGFAGDDVLGGNAGDDLLDGGEGDDRLDGGTGADRLIGGAGNDLFAVDDPGDRVIERPGEGVDVVEASTSFAVPVEVEVLRLLGSAPLSAVGSRAADRLEGNAGANLLDGREGDDVLLGGPGADTLVGGRGADRFVIDTRAGGIDTIRDFRVREGDVLDLSELVTGYSGDARGFVQLSGSGREVVVGLDPDGGGDGFAPVAVIRGEIGLDVASLVANGTIVLA
ncbi:MAG: type I secretion C-terminal target domain-containing protein [Geminicoccaceae bacterium]|nr:type I secretion C-terminal target domain-containing protein [Geminicoccaceae bacterium]